jgi:hypothetical protein
MLTQMAASSENPQQRYAATMAAAWLNTLLLTEQPRLQLHAA